MARSRKDLLDFIGNNVDETTLTDQELKDRLSAYQELSGLKDTQKAWDTGGLAGQIAAELKPKIAGIGASDFALTQASQLIASKLQTQGAYDPQQIADSLKDNSPGTISKVAFESLKGVLGNYLPQVQKTYSSFYKDQAIGNVDESGNPVQPDIDRVQGLINSRTLNAGNEQQLQDYLSALPDQLKANREGFLSGELQRGMDQYSQVEKPLDLASANARGALFSGDVPDLLASGAVNVSSQVDQMRAQLEQQDNQFYFNAAYANTLRQSLQGNQNYGSFLQNQYQTALTGQGQQFQSAQNQYNINLQNTLSQNSLQRQLQLQQAQLRQQQNLYNSQFNNSLYSGIGSAVGSIGGAIVGGPIGATVGSQAGAAAGTEIGKTVG